MKKAEFDEYAKNYKKSVTASVKVKEGDFDYFASYKIARVKYALRNEKTANLRILDFGSGVGGSVPFLIKTFIDSRIDCLDVSQESLNINKEKNGYNNVTFKSYDGHSIPEKENTYDIVFTACTFHHIPHNEHIALLQEIKRVLKPNGKLFLFEHNPLNPMTLIAVKRSPLDVNANLIGMSSMRKRIKQAEFKNIKGKYSLFFPPKLKVLSNLENLIHYIPLGAQYYIEAQK
ncbi:putative type 11 SAM-dependent methyltransferase [Vibrio harveyi]|uniref:Putative SAM dependent methyltransferase n=1 Tax=Vibrio harveyi TaxID=669 RepID=S5FUW3_VIBHA|nr:class I SAM-dependent methyltransferase [Vibrio harveyi]AGQ45491.1 putative SAM dependent methyltransferase [Vibrio harveyi]AGW25587.1 putative SAM dependent methyltransferase [Vibrio harveyi]CAK6712666.1 putative type 11 SAM-dependent methyltransferase [Vibrio harveyi]